MSVLIAGSRGWIGSQLLTQFKGAVGPSFDIADAMEVRRVLDEHKPSIVINAAGKTGRPNVDWCEDHQVETLRANVTGPLVLLEECLKRNIYFVHVGSGCIYQSTHDEVWTEVDTPNFTGSFYSFTKAMSDQLLARFPVLQLRLRMPFDASTHPRSLLTKLRNYTKVLDVPNSVTYLPDFLTAIQELVTQRITGTFNMVAPGGISPYKIMKMYQEIVDPTHTFQRLDLSNLPSVVKAQRSNCVLSCTKLQKEGVKLTPAEEAVRIALTQLVRII